MATEIRMDYEATMEAAKRLGNVNDLVRDAQKRNDAARADLEAWEGAAASKGKVALARVSDALSSYDGAYWQFARFFVNAAEQFSSSDQSAARALEASWDGAYGTGGSH